VTVTAVRKDPAALTMTLTAEFDASPSRLWQLWADPRQLERWWGPPMYPATFTAHDLAADSSAPVLLLIGSPMGAGGFVTLAGHFTDCTVVTYDPRGVERSTKADPGSPGTPEEHADDLRRLATRSRSEKPAPSFVA
jgi:pimeloyl-ACP methyl ester carboxylesterase